MGTQKTVKQGPGPKRDIHCKGLDLGAWACSNSACSHGRGRDDAADVADGRTESEDMESDVAVGTRSTAEKRRICLDWENRNASVRGWKGGQKEQGGGEGTGEGTRQKWGDGSRRTSGMRAGEMK